MKKIIIFLNAIILLISCDANNTAYSHKIITVINKTNKTIYVVGSYQYPNTDAYKNTPDPLKTGFTKVLLNESTKNVLPSFGTSYESIYEYEIPSGILMVYIFDGPTLETEGWDYIKEHNLVLKRYDLTLKDLKNMNWTIAYDGL